MQWEPVLSVRLPYPISANRYWRTRVMRNKAGQYVVNTYVSPEAKAFKQEVGWLLRKAGIGHPLQGRIRVDLQLYPHCPKDWRTRMRKDPIWWADTVGRIDLDNAMKVLLDSLKAVAIVDDDQVWKTTSEVLEPEEGVDACVVLRICRGLKDRPQAAIEMLPQPVRPQEVSFP
jgi:crossover junction endodeoxyribonuclease RusA